MRYLTIGKDVANDDDGDKVDIRDEERFEVHISPLSSV